MGVGFAFSMKRKEWWQAVESSRDCTHRGWGAEGPAPADCCSCPLGGKGDTAVSGLMDVHVPHARGGREVQGSGNEMTGAGIWVLMAPQGHVRPTARTLIKPIPVSNRKSLGAGRVCVSPPGLSSEHSRPPDGCGHHPPPAMMAAALPPRAPCPGAEQSRLGWLGRCCCSKLGKWQGAAGSLGRALA